VAPISGLGTILRGILEKSINVDIKIRHEPLRALESSCYQKLQYIISAFEPHIIFLVLDWVQLKQTDEFFRSLDKEDAYVPIIVVMERCDPDEIFSFIKLGAADFITSPQTVQSWLGEVLYYG
jgi:FixJ family two-component response regulator